MRGDRGAGPPVDGVESPAEGLLTRALVAWVDVVCRRARGAVVATAALSVLLLAYAVSHLGINTSHRALLSDDLPFWQEYMAFAEVFPILDEALLVVVDADGPERARQAAEDLGARLAAQPERFHSVYVPGGGEFFERQALLYLSLEELEDLSDQLASLQPLLAELARDRSLRNLSQVLQDGIAFAEERGDGAVDLASAFDSLSRAAEAVLEGRPRAVSWTDALMSGVSEGESSRRLVVLEPVFEYDALLPGREPMRRVREAAEALGLVPEHGVRVRITGNVALNTEEMVTVAWNAALAALGSVALVSLILVTALRSARLVGSIVATLLMGLVWTSAFAAAAVGHVNVVSIAFAVLFIGLGVDFGIHLSMRYAQLVRDGVPGGAALHETAGSVGSSLALCAATTALGFYVFVPTDYRAVAELGLISGSGMLISLFCSLTVLPALLTLARGRDAGEAWRGARRFERVVTRLSLSRPRAVCAIALVLGAAAAAVASRATFDHNVVTMRDPSTESARTFAELLSDSRTSPWSIDLIAPDLAAAEAKALRLRGLDSVKRAVTLRDYVPVQQGEKLEILADLAFFVPEPSSYRSPGEPVPLAEQIASLRALRDALALPGAVGGEARRAESARRAREYLGRFLARLEELERVEGERAVARLEESLTGTLPDQMTRLWRALSPEPVTLENLPRDLARRMVAPDGRARVEVLPRYDLGDNVAHASFVDGVRAEAPNATGSAVSLLEWGRSVVHSFQQALASAVAVVALVLWLIWRRLGDTLLVLLPLLLAAVLTAATAVLLGIAFNFANVIVLPLLFGIGVDSGVHMVHRYREVSQKTPGAGPLELLGSTTAHAVFFSAITTMGSFGSLAFSSHVGFASLGKLLVIGVLFTLVCNLVVLPALMAAAEGRGSRRAPRPKAAA